MSKQPERINIHEQFKRFREGRRETVEHVVPRQEGQPRAVDRSRVVEEVSDEAWWGLFEPYDRLHLGS